MGYSGHGAQMSVHMGRRWRAVMAGMRPPTRCAACPGPPSRPFRPAVVHAVRGPLLPDQGSHFLIPAAGFVDLNVNWRGSTRRDLPSHRMEGTAMTVAVTRLDVSAADLREAAARTSDAKAARRMLAIALLLEGWSRQAAAEACAMERQMLRDWVHRYNEAGLDGMTGGAATARRPACLPSSRPSWRHGWSSARIWSGTVWRVGAASICSGGSCRSLPSNCTSARRANCCASCRSDGCRCGRSIRKASRGTSGFQSSFADLMTAALSPEAAGKPVEIWFTDEARVGQQGTIKRVWAKRGSRPRAPRDRR